MAIFGAVPNNAPILSKGKLHDIDFKGRSDKKGVMVYHVGTVGAKHWLYSRLSADADKQREVIVAEAYRDAQKVKGEGDAKASALYADAFGRDPQFAQFYRSLEAYKTTFSKKSDLMVVDPSSDFFKAMRSSGVAPPAMAAPTASGAPAAAPARKP